MESGRAKYVTASDSEALEAFKTLSETEGIMPALESAHAVSFATDLAGKLGNRHCIIVNLSGRGDKDVDIVARSLRE